MDSQIKLYDSTNIDDLFWPDTEDAYYARMYLVQMIKNGVSAYINNIQTELKIITIDNLALPITINNAEYSNSYVCSPYTHYVTYAIEELKALKSPVVEAILSCIIRILGIILKLGQINKVIHVNNWLISTNLYPELSGDQIRKITSFLKTKYPDHTIVFRSVNDYAYPNLTEKFQECGYRLIASRQVYFLDKDLIRGKAKWLIKKDFKLLDENRYKLLEPKELTQDDIARIRELYNYLYLDKYSLANPQFNCNFIELALRDSILNIRAFKKDEKIDAVLGYFNRNGVMTTPLFGYDTNLPINTGLYRMLSAQLIKESEKLGLLLNQSSGAASFKRCRASTGHIEYNAIYNEHLSFKRRFCWSILEVMLNRLGISLLKNHNL